jgi:hypothetical protein
MSTEHEEHSFPHLRHRHKRKEGEQDTPGVDEFVEIHESDVPWDTDQPIVREDEHYERLASPETYPSEGVPAPGGIVPPQR